MRLAGRLYRLLLKLYPARFREEYAVPMLRQFEEDYAEVRGARARIRFWMGTLADVARSAPVLISEEIAADSRHAFRLWRGRPFHTIFAMLVLGIAIGASTGLFSVLNALLLRPLPFEEPERLVTFERFGPPIGDEYHTWRAQAAYLSDAASYTTFDVNLEGPTDGRRVTLTGTTWNFFSVLGRQPVIGRAFSSGEDQAGRNAVAVISNRLWHQAYGADSPVLGSTIRINGATLTVVGVAPAGFDYPQGTDLWAPTVFDWKAIPRTSFVGFFRTVGRLAPPLAWSEAKAAFEADAHQTAPQLRDRDPAERPALVPLRDHLAGPVPQASLLLLAGVALLLMLACANIANLLLARTVGRVNELRIRTALGASRARLAQQLLTESVLLALAAALAGLLVAWWTTQVATAVQPAELASQAYTIVDWRVLAFACALALGTGLLFGLGPALYALGTDLSSPGHVATASYRHARTRTVLVAAQITVSLVLLTGSVALGRAFVALLHVDNGYQLRSITTMSVSLAGTAHQDSSRAAAYYSEVLRRMREIPGVISASMTEALPLHDDGVAIFGFRLDHEARTVAARIVTVSPDYLATIGTRVLVGREFTEHDLTSPEPVALVNDEFAWQFGDPTAVVGRSLLMDGVKAPPRAIVGVVAGMRHGGPAYPPGPQVFGLSRTPRAAHIVVRVGGQARTRLAQIRDAVQAVDPKVPVFDVRTMEERLDEVLARPRFYATTAVFFGGIALLLAVVGVYGVVSYSVVQRTREMGIRLALGTTPARLRATLLRQSILPVAVGSVAGVALALIFSRYLQTLVAGADAAPLATTLIGVALTGSVAALAVWSATRHVTRLDVADVLRAETE